MLEDPHQIGHPATTRTNASLGSNRPNLARSAQCLARLKCLARSATTRTKLPSVQRARLRSNLQTPNHQTPNHLPLPNAPKCVSEGYCPCCEAATHVAAPLVFNRRDTPRKWQLEWLFGRAMDPRQRAVTRPPLMSRIAILWVRGESLRCGAHIGNNH